MSHQKPIEPVGNTSSFDLCCVAGMGCAASNNLRRLENKKTNDQIVAALRNKRDAVKAKGNEPVSMEKIILKFNSLRGTCTYLKQLFHSVADKSAEPGLDIEGLSEVMTKLHGEVKLEDVQGLYRFCDVDKSNRIDLKELLVALTVDHMLEKFPVVEASNNTATEGQLANSSQLNEYFELIIQAYLLFDTDVKVLYVRFIDTLFILSSEDFRFFFLIFIDSFIFLQGYITKKSVDALIGGFGEKGGGLLSEQRWKEMDWDSDGSIDFGEFVITFSGWIDMEEDE